MLVQKRQPRVVPTKAQPPARRRRRIRRRNQAQSRIQLSDCAMSYALALANPWDGPLACVPSFPALLTRKFRTFIRGEFSTSTTSGFGFVCIDPLSMATSDNIQQCAATVAGYLGNTIELHSPTVGVRFFQSNSDYTANTFNPVGLGANVRIVSAGLRIKTATTVFNTGGIVQKLQEPNHNSLENFSVVDMLEYSEAERSTLVPGEWYSLYYKPVTVNELQNFFSSNSFANNPAAGAYVNEASNYMGIIVNSALVASGFIFEAFATFEASGGAIRGKTLSEVDPVGLGKVQSISADPEFSNHAPSVLEGLVRGVKRGLETAGEQAVNLAYQYGKYRVGEYLTRGVRTDTRVIMP